MKQMKMDPKGKKFALLIVDMQKRFTLDWKDPITQFKKPIEIIEKTASLFRDAGLPVIFIKMTGPDMHQIYKGNDGDDIFDDITVNDKDIIVLKKHMNSFKETELKDILQKEECNAVLISGLVTNYCVASTYYASFDNGFSPYLLEGGCLSLSEETNKCAYHIMKILDVDEIEQHLRN